MQYPWHEQLRIAQTAFDSGDFERATTNAEAVLAIQPQCAAAYEVLGLVDYSRHHIDDAIEQLENAIRLKPDLVPSHNYLGMSFGLKGQLDRAMQLFEQALVLMPANPFARFNRAMGLLKQGQFAEGWIEFEWRWQSAGLPRPEIPVPRWDGSSLEGRTILIHTEQGFGDTLQCMRFLPRLRQLGAEVWFACQTPMQEVLQRIEGVDHWMPIDQQVEINFELYSPLMSLPALLRLNSTDQFSVSTPYLHAQPERVERWRKRLLPIQGMRIGIGWQGSTTFRGDYWRSVPLKQFATLARIPNVSLISLQKHDGMDQLRSSDDPLLLHRFDDLDSDAAFVDTIAVMNHLDLVITCDTALAHLAGAAGIPVWLLLSTGSDWRWMNDRDDTPWYPTMRIFRQSTLSDWDTVFQDVVTQLMLEHDLR